MWQRLYALFLHASIAAFIGLLILRCGKKDEPIPETLIARIGDKTISQNEFIRRAEYTIRPE